MSPDIRHLVIRAPNWLGDAVMALPALSAVRGSLAEAHITIAAIPSIAPLFEEPTSARQDALLVVPDVKREASTLATAKFDAALLFPNSFRSAWSAWRAGIPERWGYSSSFRRPLLTRTISRPRDRVHQSAYYLHLVHGLGLTAADQPPRVSIAPTTRARADRILAEYKLPADAPMIGFAPGAAYGHAKRWPPRRVAELVVRLSHERGAVAVLFGAGGDRAAGREIESSLPPGSRVVNLIGRTDLRLLAGLMARCAAFVSNDSGAMHLAGALGVPLVAIFGPTDDRVTAPLGGPHAQGELSKPYVLTHPVFCRPCMLRDCPIDHRCMKRITVDHVFSAVTRQLEALGRSAGQSA
jgi:heptosyltransferase-2